MDELKKDMARLQDRISAGWLDFLRAIEIIDISKK